MTLAQGIWYKIRARVDRGMIQLTGGCNPRSWWYQRTERRLPAYSLPEPLRFFDRKSVADSHSWRGRRRPELVEAFRDNLYGHSPGRPSSLRAVTISQCENALNGSAWRREIAINLTGELDGPTLNLLLYLPRKSAESGGKVPFFLGLNFFGNHTIHHDHGITVPECWIPDNSVTNGKAADLLRGVQSSSWPVEHILAHGYGLATAYCGEIVPDRSDGLKLGVTNRFPKAINGRSELHSWGAISAWAWGLSRAMDYLQQDVNVDANRIAVVGHSRLGKAALWAGAQDERFALVISNQSGCCGAALSRRRFRETIGVLARVNPHWLCANSTQYIDNEDALPIDQHLLIALMAPRPVYVGSAQLDFQADPMGEFLGLKHAEPVYQLLGTNGFPAEELPPVNTPIMATMGYHMRKGRHGITAYDWSQYLAFANKHFS